MFDLQFQIRMDANSDGRISLNELDTVGARHALTRCVTVVFGAGMVLGRPWPAQASLPLSGAASLDINGEFLKVKIWGLSKPINLPDVFFTTVVWFSGMNF